MIKSMTGYGKAVCELPGKKISIDLKSLNSKQLDLNIKLPYNYREKEIIIRNILSNNLERGKIDLYVNIENSGEVLNYKINKEAAMKYYSEIKELANAIGEKDNNLLDVIIKLPEVLKSESNEMIKAKWSFGGPVIVT